MPNISETLRAIRHARYKDQNRAALEVDVKRHEVALDPRKTSCALFNPLARNSDQTSQIATAALT